MLRSLTLLLLIASSVQAQNFYINSVVGQYAMSDLRSIQDDELNQYIQATQVQVKKELSFPLSLQIELGGNYNLDSKNGLGVFFNYGLTKGQLGYKDFSGEVLSTQSVWRYSMGVKYFRILTKHFSLYSKFSYVRSDLNLSNQVTALGAILSSTKIDFYSKGYSIEPGFAVSYTLWKRISAQLVGGYEFNFQGKTFWNDDSNYYLLTGSGNKATIDWSGYRIGLGIIYSIK